MPRKQTLRLKTRARLLAGRNDTPIPAADLVRDWKRDMRLLYERSSFTVREIAGFAGIGERMLYKYAAAGNWTDRETRVSLRLLRLDPQEAERIVARARERVRMTDMEASRQATRLVVDREDRRSVIATKRTTRIQTLLMAALIDLAGQESADPRHSDAAEAAGRLIFQQMRETSGMADDGAGEANAT